MDCSVTDRLAAATSAAPNAIAGGWTVSLVSVATTGWTGVTIEVAPVLSIPAGPNATSHTRTEAGRAASRHKAAIVANRACMITFSEGAD
jgi:hypothetical protein